MTSSNLIYLEVPEVIPLLIEAGEITYDEAVALGTRYDAFLAKLDAEWTPTRLKEFLLTRQRNKLRWLQKKWETLELENADARKKGVSYKEREKYSSQIATLKKMWQEDREQGIKLSKATLKASNLVKPLDLEFIESRGFEEFLKYNFYGVE